MFFGRGLRIGRIFGVQIGVDYTWFVIFALFVYILGASFFPAMEGLRGASPLLHWGAAVITTLLFFGSVLAHEMSHAMVARRNGIPVNSITLFIFGGVAQMEDEPGTPFKEFKMAIAGPIASVLIGALCIGLLFVAAAFEVPVVFWALYYLGLVNIVLAVFNLLPAFPLDGGRVFRAAVWGATHNLRTATYVASLVGQAFGWIFVVLGVGSIFFEAIGRYVNIWFALIGWFVISAARSSYQQVVVRETLSQVPVRDVMSSDVQAVPADITIDHLVTEYFLRESAMVLPVERNGELLGMVSVEDVRNLPRERWATTMVWEITPSMADEQVVQLADDAWDAANRMAQANRDRVLVTADGHVEGVVTRGTIARWLQTHTRWAMGQA